ncbi:MAG: S9 family peptidase [Bacteroidales bacterium]|nr:S9 family peptidase [Bacteroidales bacterium]
MKKMLMCMVLAMLAAGGGAAAQQHAISLEDIWTSRTFAAKGIGGLRSMADGEHYCTLGRTGISKYSYATGKKVADVCLFRAPEGMAKVKALPAFNGYWFSADERKILLSAEYEPIYRRSGVSSYWLYDVEKQSFTWLSRKGKQRLTTLSPDGEKVAFVRDNNLYWMDIATLEEHAVTTDGKMNEVINGTTDWVYEEEFAITQGFAWSPDSRRIAFLRFDESRVKEYDMQMWGQLYPATYSYKYPKAGEKNSVVGIYVYDIAQGNTVQPKIGGNGVAEVAAEGAEWEYLPRFQWTTDASTLAVMRMNRLQNHMDIIAINVENQSISTLYEETSESYVEVPDVWSFIGGKGNREGEQMLITSERSGFRHVYLYGMDGRQVRQITTGEWEVSSVCAIDERNQRLYYTSHEHGATGTSLYVVSFTGKSKRCLDMTSQELEKTGIADKGAAAYRWREGGYVCGTYGANFSNGCKYYIRTFSDANHPTLYTLHDAKGKLVKVLEDNVSLAQKMQEYGTGHKQFGTLTTERGDELNYYIITPANFDSTQPHPLLIYVYGGPGNQQVVDGYGGADYYWFHMLAQEGYIVACFDGRGTGGRGAHFKKQTYLNLGKMECEDAVAAATWFGQRPWIDKERIGIFGWSFGGYLSSLALLKGQGVYKSAIAVAPVTNWRYYDNIYTERFLGLPQDNAAGYDDNSPLNFAGQLQGNYLLVHGTGDDNVHFQNSAELIDRLEKAGKQFDLRIYPNKNHSIYDATGQTRLNLYLLMTDFIRRKL